jgi:hypothetical protein
MIKEDITSAKLTKTAVRIRGSIGRLQKNLKGAPIVMETELRVKGTYTAIPEEWCLCYGLFYRLTLSYLDLGYF